MPRAEGIDEAALAACVDEIYETATFAGPERWRTALQNLSRACGAHGALLLPPPGNPIPPLWSAELDEAVAYGLKTGFLADNPRMVRAMHALRRPDDFVTEWALFSPEELRRQPFQVDYAQRFGLATYLGFALAPAGQASVYASIGRRPDQGPFESRELEIVGRVLPHLHRAGRLALQVAEAHGRGALDALEALRRGGILIGPGGRIVGVNRPAERHLGQDPARGLALGPDGTLTAHHREANARLQRLVASVLGPASGLAYAPVARGPDGHDAVAVPREGARRSALVLQVAPLVGVAGDLFRRAKALVTIVDPDAHREPAEAILRQSVALTSTEARVALALGRGLDVVEIAAAHGVSEGTVRSQLKAIFAKTATRRQSEIVALVHRFAHP